MFLRRRHGKLYAVASWRGDDGRVYQINYRADSVLVAAIKQQRKDRAERKRLGAELTQTGIKLKAILNDQEQALTEVMNANGFHYCKGEWRQRRKVYTSRKALEV